MSTDMLASEHNLQVQCHRRPSSSLSCNQGSGAICLEGCTSSIERIDAGRWDKRAVAARTLPS